MRCIRKGSREHLCVAPGPVGRYARDPTASRTDGRQPTSRSATWYSRPRNRSRRAAARRPQGAVVRSWLDFLVQARFRPGLDSGLKLPSPCRPGTVNSAARFRPRHVRQDNDSSVMTLRISSEGPAIRPSSPAVIGGTLRCRFPHCATSVARHPCRDRQRTGCVPGHGAAASS